MSLHDTVLRWWDGRLGSAGAALDILTAPAELMYRGIIETRNSLYDSGTLESVRLPAAVISIGNVAIGGTGKTPVTAWLARQIRDMGARPAVLHGGYASDEPALHAALNPDIPVFAGRDRVAGGRTAIAQGADVLVLDDGFQHRRLDRDLDIVLVAAETWSHSHRTLPRGPWREAASALARADHVIVTRRTAARDRAHTVAAEAGAMTPNVTIVTLEATVWRRGDHAFDDLTASAGAGPHGGAPIGSGPSGSAPADGTLLVCAIAGPAAFEQNARAAGAVLRGSLFYTDHHEYDADDAANILKQAGNGSIVTTAKDWIKLAALLPAERVWVLHQAVVLEEGGDALLSAVRTVLP